MKKTKTTLAQFAAIAMLSVGAFALSSANVGAAVDLSAADLSSISTAVQTAINNVTVGSGFTQAQIDAAYAAAISAETQALIAQYGNTNPMLIAEAVVTAAGNNAHVTPTQVGEGMAAAAIAEGGTTAIEIADAVGSTAPSGAVSAFETAANNAGTPLGQTLAAAASSYTNIGAGGGSNGSSHSFFGGSGNGQGGGQGGGGCRNPSCT